MVFFVGAGTEIGLTRQLAVHHDGAVVKTHRTGKTTHAAGDFSHLRFIGKGNGMFRNAQGIDQLDFVQVPVSTDKSGHIAVFFSFLIIGNEEQRLDGFFLGQLQIGGHLLNGFGSRGINGFQRKHGFVGIRSIREFSPLRGGCHFAGFTVSDFAFPYFGEGGELMGIAAADGSRIRFHCPESQPASGKDLFIGIVHIVVASVQAFVIPVKGIGILHDELPAPHQAETGSCLVPVFGLNLIQVQGKLTVGGYIVPNHVGKDFLMGGSQAEIPAVPVLETPEFRPVSEPSSRLHPQLCRLYGGHVDLLPPLGIHFLSDNIFNLPQGPVAHGHKAINAGNQFPDHAGSQQQYMAGDFSFCRNLPEGLQVHL